jgi:anti-sigma28 factor (negative regulator of flagellin synthesis)
MARADDMTSMRVDQRNLTGAAAAETGKARESQAIGRDGRTGSSRSGGAGSDQVDLSPLSRALNASASSRSSRVEQLSAQYRAGQYQPDPAEVSKSMVGDALASSNLL